MVVSTAKWKYMLENPRPDFLGGYQSYHGKKWKITERISVSSMIAGWFMMENLNINGWKWMITKGYPHGLAAGISCDEFRAAGLKFIK